MKNAAANFGKKRTNFETVLGFKHRPRQFLRTDIPQSLLTYNEKAHNNRITDLKTVFDM